MLSPPQVGQLPTGNRECRGHRLLAKHQSLQVDKVDIKQPERVEGITQVIGQKIGLPRPLPLMKTTRPYQDL